MKVQCCKHSKKATQASGSCESQNAGQSRNCAEGPRPEQQRRSCPEERNPCQCNEHGQQSANCPENRRSCSHGQQSRNCLEVPEQRGSCPCQRHNPGQQCGNCPGEQIPQLCGQCRNCPGNKGQRLNCRKGGPGCHGIFKGHRWGKQYHGYRPFKCQRHHKCNFHC